LDSETPSPTFTIVAELRTGNTLNEDAVLTALYLVLQGLFSRKLLSAEVWNQITVPDPQAVTDDDPSPTRLNPLTVIFTVVAAKRNCVTFTQERLLDGKNLISGHRPRGRLAGRFCSAFNSGMLGREKDPQLPAAGRVSARLSSKSFRFHNKQAGRPAQTRPFGCSPRPVGDHLGIHGWL
jgi:hypothetical protein